VGLAAAGLLGVSTCRPAAPRVARSPSCHVAQPIPVCEGDDGRDALTIEQTLSRANDGQAVRVRGRLVLGAGCCASCSPCRIYLALAPEGTGTITPPSGPLALLTSEESVHQQASFQDIGYMSFPGRCLWTRSEGYCCDWDVSGQLVVASGHLLPSPKASSVPSADFSNVCDPSPSLAARPGDLGCFLQAPWRHDLDQVMGFAVTRACQLRE
jgi:hypothetical protein